MDSSIGRSEEKNTSEERVEGTEKTDSDTCRFSDEEAKKAAEKAMWLLSFQDRTKKELRDRLCRAGFSEKATEEALAYAIHSGYVNDRRYVETYIMFQQEKKSAREIRYKLEQKGISQDLIRQVFEETEYDGEEKAIERLIQKKLKGRPFCELDDAEKRKIMAYLGRKGYDWNCVRKVFSELDN